MNREQFERLKVGDLVRNNAHDCGEAYVIVAVRHRLDGGVDSFTAIRTATLTNPLEWKQVDHDGQEVDAQIENDGGLFPSPEDTPSAMASIEKLCLQSPKLIPQLGAIKVEPGGLKFRDNHGDDRFFPILGGSVRGLLKGKGYHVWERDGELVVSERTASMIGDASAIWLGYVKTLT
ncbi:MAG: hypothetical protein NW206_19575, partial [Hyphomonadaceae bacterium]|nr:hypothetical protein [Hyphomonadaceae bacterium]